MENKKTPRIVFLDIDGVLNSEVDFNNYTEEEMHQYHDIAKRPLELLDEFITETKALIVISSTWRKNKTVDELRAIFKEKGFKNCDSIIAKTPVLGEGTVRGNEIKYWIEKNEEIINCKYYDFCSYVIFDDDSDMLLWQRENYFRIDGYIGLTLNVLYRAKLFFERTK